MPPRRRRDGAAVPARTKGQPVGRVRVPVRWKAPRSSQRHCLSRGGVRDGSWPERSRARVSRPREQSRRRPGCPERHEEGTRDVVRDTRIAFSRAPRPATCLAGGRGSQASVRQRIERPTQPASVGAGNSRARVEGSLGVPVRRIQVAEVGKRRRG